MTKSERGYKLCGRMVCWMLLLGMLTPASAAEPRSLVVLGDSLSAAYGMAVEQGWVALLGQRLGDDFQIVNASISGETSRGGRTRLPGLLKTHRPQIVVLELGGNDGLRGIPLVETRSNLMAIIEASRQAGAKVLLVGMRLPPNLGAAYGESFASLYRELARHYGLSLVPFLLEGVGRHPEWMQQDGLHPRPAAQARLLENLWAHLQPLL